MNYPVHSTINIYIKGIGAAKLVNLESDKYLDKVMLNYTGHYGIFENATKRISVVLGESLLRYKGRGRN